MNHDVLATAIDVCLGAAFGAVASRLWRSSRAVAVAAPPQERSSLDQATDSQGLAYQALRRAQATLSALQHEDVPDLGPLPPLRPAGQRLLAPPIKLLAQQAHKLLEIMEGLDGFASHTLSNNEALRDTLSKVSQAANLVDIKLGQVAPVFNEAALLSTAVTDHLQGLHDTSKVSLLRAAALQAEWQGAFDLLGHFSQAIQSMEGSVQSVQDLANKAKLLSLNAAIVASQSQEHGQGFNVVAEQIKVMAQRTLEAAHGMQAGVQAVGIFHAQFEQLASGQQESLTQGGNAHQAVQQLALVALSTNASLRQLLSQRAQGAVQQNASVNQLKDATAELIGALIELNAALRLQDKDHRRAQALTATVAHEAAKLAQEHEAADDLLGAKGREPALLACIAWLQRHKRQEAVLKNLAQALGEVQGEGLPSVAPSPQAPTMQPSS